MSSVTARRWVVQLRHHSRMCLAVAARRPAVAAAAVVVVLVLAVQSQLPPMHAVFGTAHTSDSHDQHSLRTPRAALSAAHAGGVHHFNNSWTHESVHVPLTIFTVLNDVSPSAGPQRVRSGVATDSRHGLPDLGWEQTHLETIAAVHSWLALGGGGSGGVNVLLYGSASTCAAYLGLPALSRESTGSAPRLRCRVLKCFQEGIPRLDCVFKDMRSVASTETVMYANADIAVFNDLLLAIHTVREQASSFFIVGKRYNLNMSTELRQSIAVASNSGFGISTDWLNQLQQEAELQAQGHRREGIDYMVFLRELTPVLPPFLVGRIQWDNWILLWAITNPTMISVEVSQVVLALHLDHGSRFSSHTKNGTLYNKRLAVYLPHPWVKETKVYHAGTIWLGRLDEVDANLVPEHAQWRERSPSYFSDKKSLPVERCPTCVVVRNEQSWDTMLFTAHAMAHGRRTVVLVRVSARQVSQAARYHCVAATRGVHNILFVTTELETHVALRGHGMNSVHLAAELGVGTSDPVARFFGFLSKSLYDGYNVAVASLNHVLVTNIEHLVSEKTDVAFPSEGPKFNFWYLRSRGRTFRLSNAVGQLVQKHLLTAHVAPYSWRESAMVEQAITNTIETFRTWKDAPQFEAIPAHKLGSVIDSSWSLPVEAIDPSRWSPRQLNCTAALAHTRKVARAAASAAVWVWSPSGIKTR